MKLLDFLEIHNNEWCNQYKLSVQSEYQDILNKIDRNIRLNDKRVDDIFKRLWQKELWRNTQKQCRELRRKKYGRDIRKVCDRP
jgi:hypothetical protein